MNTQQVAIAERLKTLTLCHGLGSNERHTACTISALNLALTGQLTDERPDCVSLVLHAFVIPLQDALPEALLNGAGWRDMVPLLAGTYPVSPAVEALRLDAIIAWMWECLSSITAHVPDSVRLAWVHMCTARNQAGAAGVVAAAEAAAVWAEAAAVWAAAEAAVVVTKAAVVWAAAAEAAVVVAKAWAAAEAAVVGVAGVVAAAEAAAMYWNRADPVGLLLRLIMMGEEV